MSLKSSILSLLFGSGSDESKQEELDDTMFQKTVEEEPAKEAPVAPDPTVLKLPLEHELYQLWELRRKQAGRLPAPFVCLRGPQEFLPDRDVGKEIVRLRMLVTSTAQKRLADAIPKSEKDSDKKEPEKDQGTPESSTSNEKAKEPRPVNLDAQVEVFIPRNEMTAWVLVYPPVGEGKEVDCGMLEKALADNGVVYGVDDSLLKRLPEVLDCYFHLFLAAVGKEPVHGKDGYIVDMYPRHAGRELTMNESGQVNYAELNMVHNAAEGDVICQIKAPVPGEPGRTVLDRELTAKDGKEAKVPKGRNTQVSEDGSTLVASKPGHVEFDGRNFVIKPVLEIGKNVDYSTGNINFLGDIHIHGDVCGGFTVRAMGNITVDGVVEDSTIEAGGDLIVAKGVKGNGQAFIRAHRSIYAKYLESTIVCAKEELHSDCIIHCHVYSDGLIKANSGRGIIVGGKVRAANEVQANIVGSRSECLTSISLGGCPSDEFEYENLLREIETLEAEYADLERQPDSPAKTRNMPMVRMKLSVDRTRLKQFENDLGNLKEKLRKQEEEQDHRKLVCGIVYPGTEVTIGDVTLHVDHETQQCRARLWEGEIHLR